jgi:hypothetical protein
LHSIFFCILLLSHGIVGAAFYALKERFRVYFLSIPYYFTIDLTDIVTRVPSDPPLATGSVPFNFVYPFSENPRCFLLDHPSRFLLWAIMLTDWVNSHRRAGTFNPTLPLILFLDGHISRDNAAAISHFSQNNIIVITFPAQLTHVIQPVDVCIGAPFRHAYRRLLRLRKLKWKATAAAGQKLTAGEKREMMIGASVEATQQATIKSNRESAFQCTGLCPYNPNTPCQGPYVRQDLDAPIHPHGRIVKRDTISAKVLTSPDILPTLTI